MVQDLRDLIPRVAAYAPGVADPVAEQYLRDSAIQDLDVDVTELCDGFQGDRFEPPAVGEVEGQDSDILTQVFRPAVTNPLKFLSSSGGKNQFCSASGQCADKSLSYA